MPAIGRQLICTISNPDKNSGTRVENSHLTGENTEVGLFAFSQFALLTNVRAGIQIKMYFTPIAGLFLL